MGSKGRKANCQLEHKLDDLKCLYEKKFGKASDFSVPKGIKDYWAATAEIARQNRSRFLKREVDIQDKEKPNSSPVSIPTRGFILERFPGGGLRRVKRKGR